MIKRIILFVAIVAILVGCSKWEFSETVSGKITEKYYKRAYTTTQIIPAGKVMIPTTRYHPARYIVAISYGDISTSVNNKDLFDEVDVGDTVPVSLYENEKGKQRLSYD